VVAQKKTKMKGSTAKKPAPEKSHAGKSHPCHEGHEYVVTIDRRKKSRERRGKEVAHGKVEPPVAERHVLERRAKVNRRRQIDPTTCERDYTSDEVEFMAAIDEYKRLSGRMFPTCSEVLEVLKKLGYEKRSEVEMPETPAISASPMAAPIVMPAGMGSQPVLTN
jgi:hypothetical protein